MKQMWKQIPVMSLLVSTALASIPALADENLKVLINSAPSIQLKMPAPMAAESMFRGKSFSKLLAENMLDFVGTEDPVYSTTQTLLDCEASKTAGVQNCKLSFSRTAHRAVMVEDKTETHDMGSSKLTFSYQVQTRKVTGKPAQRSIVGNTVEVDFDSGI
jgi:hypothetical protein